MSSGPDHRPASTPAAPEGDTLVQPGLGWILRAPSRFVAFGFGSGLIRPAPGTWGTLMGWVLWVVVLSRLSPAGVAVVVLVSFLYGCLACQWVGKALGRSDHGGMVWDEIVAIWLVLWLTADTFMAQLVAFGVFRLFDIVKPPPIRYFDARLKNGFGVMWDDIVAAAYTLLLMAVIHYGAGFSLLR